MTILSEWARAWNIPQDALRDLQSRLTRTVDVLPADGVSEAHAQQVVRLDASKAGARLWRNNVGAFTDERGAHVRYGLCNESKPMNQAFKSADLIGITPVVVQQRHVGMVFGVFTSVEVKRPGWTFRGTGREGAQKSWADLVTSLGGVAYFSTGEWRLL